MKIRFQLLFIIVVLLFVFASCGTKVALPDNAIVFETGETDDYAYIIWEEKKYVPYCSSESDQIGDCLGYYEEDGEKIYVCELKGQSSDKWLIDTLNLENCNEGMIYKQENVTEIPEGLSSEYAWNAIKVVDKTACYKLIQMDRMFYCDFYDANHHVVKSEGPWNNQPHLSMVDDHTVKFTIQAGTGLSTQWGYFYDAERNLFSQTFYSIYDACNGNFVYRDLEDREIRLVVRGIFDFSSYYEEITVFQYPLSEAAEPIIEAKFVKNGTAVEVTYLTGADYEQVTETFELNLPELESEEAGI